MGRATGVSDGLWIENAVLHYKKSEPVADANATLTLTKGFFIKMWRAPQA